MNTGRRAILTCRDYTRAAYHCEYLVIGSGAGGSVAAALLAEDGRDVILLEEGGYHPTEDLTDCISEMTAALYRNCGVFPFLGRPAVAFAEGCCVGGGTLINGALVWRTPPWVLDEWCQRFGLSGYGNDDLRGHFETIERDLHVERHELEQTQNMDSLRLWEGARRLGWKCVMAPRAIKGCGNDNLCPTGCLSGAKQSALVTYIPRALNHGARLLCDCRAQKIIHSRGVATEIIARVSDGRGGRAIEITCDQLVLAGGAVQTPHLLRRSGVSRRAGRSLEFHLNLKVVALFADEVFAERGTIFTTQVQEFEREGILICASNLRPAYVAMTLSHLGNEAINHVIGNYSRAAIYVAMTRPRSKAHVVSAFGDQPVVWYRFEPGDLADVKTALRHTAEVLFASGAVELYLPIAGAPTISSLDALDAVLETLRPTRLQPITVHVMASCPMGTRAKTSCVNPEGRLWNMDNVLIADASVLPSSIGESPQGTIMAFVHEIMRRHLAS